MLMVLLLVLCCPCLVVRSPARIGGSSLSLDRTALGLGGGDAIDIDHDEPTAESLARVWSRVDGALSGEALASLPHEKRAVASELHRVLRTAYRAEEMVLDEIERVEKGLRGS